MNSRQFLLVGGIILLLVGILGFIGVIGPTAEKSIFGDFWWFDNGENWAHTILGVAGILSVYVLPANLQKGLVMLLGIISVLVGLYSLIISESFLGATLQNPPDTILHLVVGAWALWASMRKESIPAAPTI